MLDSALVFTAFGGLCLLSAGIVVYLLRQLRVRDQQIIDTIVARVGLNSSESLHKSTEVLLRLANDKLSSERTLTKEVLTGQTARVSEQYQDLRAQLDRLSGIMANLEKERAEKLGELSAKLSQTSEQTAQLLSTTSKLTETLTHSQARGQWGERIAEDLLRCAGLVENVSYRKQEVLPNGLRPDFTFLLPGELRLFMDVKFPLQKYREFLAAGAEDVQTIKGFVKDVRTHYRDLATRKYYEQPQTIDCVLVFFPHDSIFAVLQQHATDLLDWALGEKIVTCSPMTLFPMLTIIRQSIDAFHLEQTAAEACESILAFRKQWDLYQERSDVLGKKIADVMQEFERLSTTRTRALERALSKVEQLEISASRSKSGEAALLT